MTVKELFKVIPSMAQTVTIVYKAPNVEVPITEYYGEVHVAKESNRTYLNRTVTDIWISNVGNLHINCV